MPCLGESWPWPGEEPFERVYRLGSSGDLTGWWLCARDASGGAVGGGGGADGLLSEIGGEVGVEGRAVGGGGGGGAAGEIWAGDRGLLLKAFFAACIASDGEIISFVDCVIFEGGGGGGGVDLDGGNFSADEGGGGGGGAGGEGAAAGGGMGVAEDGFLDPTGGGTGGFDVPGSGGGARGGMTSDEG